VASKDGRAFLWKRARVTLYEGRIAMRATVHAATRGLAVTDPVSTAYELAKRYTLGERQLAWAHLADANLSNFDLSDAYLFRGDFTNADLTDAKLPRSRPIGVKFIGAKLVRADLNWANLYHADLSGADLSGSNLQGANLTTANLSNANLTGVNLSSANLEGAIFTGATLDGVTLGSTIFANLDLSEFCRATTVRHASPSIVDYRAVMKSISEPGLRDFLRATGMPEALAVCMIACVSALEPPAGP